MHPAHLQGLLLVAHPSLTEKTFRRTVIQLLLHHPQRGALGLILNRPLPSRAADHLDESTLGPLATAPVFHGGPVAEDQLTFAALLPPDSPPDPTQGALRAHLSLDQARHFAATGQGHIRAYLGHSGWGGGQLEDELRQQAWLVARPEPAILHLPDAHTRLWGHHLAQFGPAYQLLAQAPDRPDLN